MLNYFTLHNLLCIFLEAIETNTDGLNPCLFKTLLHYSESILNGYSRQQMLSKRDEFCYPICFNASRPYMNISD